MTILVNAAAIKAPTVYITGSGSVKLTWKSGKSQPYSSDTYANLGGLDTVTIIPDPTWHIDAVSIDGILIEGIPDDGRYDGFSLVNVQAKSNVSVTFLINNGIDGVKTGDDVEAYPYPNMRLVFYDVQTGGFATADPTIGRSIADQIYEYWDIQTTAIFNSQGVEVVLVYSLDEVLAHDIDPYSLRLMRTDRSIDLARADVNLDGKIDGTDVSIVGNANPSMSGDLRYDPRCDVCDPIGLIDDRDVNFVNNYIGESSGWEDVPTKVEVVGDLVYVHGETDHLSIFGVH